MSKEVLQKEIAELKQKIRTLEEEKNSAYTERNKCVAVLARIFPAGIRKTDIPGWDKALDNCVYIDTPTGQCSWHYHDKDAHLFEHLPTYTKPYDGHTTEQKYARLDRYVYLRDIPHAISQPDDDKIRSFIAGVLACDSGIAQSEAYKKRLRSLCMYFTKGRVSPRYIEDQITNILDTQRANPHNAPNGLRDNLKKLDW